MVKYNGKTLLVGPWVGEFGWELFCWQAYVRGIASEFEKIIVISREGHDFLYEDFATEFIAYNPPEGGKSDGWYCDEVTSEMVDDLRLDMKYDTILTPKNIGFYYLDEGVAHTSPAYKRQKFIVYESDSLDEEYDIIIHARNRDVGDERNWNGEKWQKLVDLLLKNEYTIAAIGTDETFTLDGVTDRRNIPIKDTISLMNRCELVVGPSSGPMHLASLSMTPHLVWSTSYNKNRYLGAWNPHKTPLLYYDKEGWDPKVYNIYNRIIKIFKHGI